MSEEFWREQAQQLAIQRDTLIRERDEARAKLDAWDGLKRQEANEAEARGYRKGVEDAVAAGDKMAKEGTYGWVWLRAAILALLEQTPTPAPHHITPDIDPLGR